MIRYVFKFDKYIVSIKMIINIKIKKIKLKIHLNENAKMPIKTYNSDACWDLFSNNIEYILKPFSVTLI